MTPLATKDRVRLRSCGWLGTVACVKPTHFEPQVYVTWDRKVDEVDAPYSPDELVGMADRWEQRWPALAAWLRELAEVPPCS